MAACDLRTEYQRLHDEGTRLAGGLTDLSQRAAVYHHLFKNSSKNHAFPLIAAHGALWAKEYFRSGLMLGRGLSWQYAFNEKKRRRQLVALDDFADMFRDINRRVCIDTYANYHFTARFGEHPEAACIVDAELLTALNRLHAARRAGHELSDDQKRAIFTAHFLHEQQHVVGPTLLEAAKRFDWPLVKFIALMPVVKFAYFPGRRFFWFSDFTSRDQRIARGLTAFNIAANVGWDNVEAALDDYAVLPRAFFADSVTYFAGLKQNVLAVG